MEFAEYQKVSRKTAIYPHVGDNYIYPALGLAGEAGELSNKIKKISRDSGDEVTNEQRQAIKEEMGDLLWYVAQLATEFDMELEDVIATNIEKLESRMERGTLHGTGDER